ncbi:SH3 domain-binding protein 1-like [Engystomops pustulosus]|uniref:SH3 domain-binding protein 1-like n=1 Tax=Engystomops pustulosus TaxID=76066 RepID=UPI003AFAC6FA
MIQRQLHRMRQQLATHGPGRSQDVTDLLPEDLLAADQQVDIMKRVAHLVGKRLANCMQGPANSDMEKRLKKLTLMSLSSAMADCMKETEGGSRLRRALEMGCCVEGSLAQALAEYEMNMERDVLQPLSKLSEEELPTILKHRKQLQKLLTDWNAAKSRLLQAQKNLSGPPGGGSPVTPPKLESLKEEEEDLRRRLDQSKDDYLSDLYQFTSKEPEYENYFIQLLELQAEYHRKSLTQLTEALGELRDTLKGSGQVPEKQLSADVYGVPLTTHLIRFGCEIALPISACVKMLLKHGIHEELLELQAEYHRKSLTQLTEALGELRDTLKGSGQVPEKQLSADVYGVPLTTHLIRFGCEIALPISACVKMLLKHGIHEEVRSRMNAGEVEKHG